MKKVICFFILCLTYVLVVTAGEKTHIDLVKETLGTMYDLQDNVDSPAAWKGPNGEHWLLVTGKSDHSIHIYDAANGFFIKKFGTEGKLLGCLKRPNGIYVSENILFVVERDNHRVQLFDLHNLNSLGSIGDMDLIKPYGIYVCPLEKNKFVVYVTDNYPRDKKNPKANTQRVRLYAIEIKNGKILEGDLIEYGDYPKYIGGESGDSDLIKVESICGDPINDNLFIADEDKSQKCIKLFSMKGIFKKKIGQGLFSGDPEGIALLTNQDGSGYWICTDQGRTKNCFYLFDRKTFELKGAFKGEYTYNTDGIWFDSTPSKNFPKGTLFAINNDGGVSFFSWKDIEAIVLQKNNDNCSLQK